jgi:Uma2 family endonuclease
MSVVLRKPWTLEEFLAWEERQELRHEFDGIEPVAMPGGTANHELIGARLRTLLLLRLDGKPCRAWGPTMKIAVNERIRYPDAFVNCTPVPGKTTIVPDPVVVFEVLGPGTSYSDRIVKLREYQATPSIRRYVILEQDSVAATVYVRRGEEWVATVHTANDCLRMPEIGVELSLAAIYADADITEATGTDASEND